MELRLRGKTFGGVPKDHWRQVNDRLDPETDFREIYRNAVAYEFPWDMNQALSFALFRTYAVPLDPALQAYADTILTWPPMLDWTKKTEDGACCELAGDPITDPAFVGEGVGIALRQEDDELREKLNAALAEMRADGTYKTINDKYFDIDVYTMK